MEGHVHNYVHVGEALKFVGGIVGNVQLNATHDSMYPE